MVRIPAPHRQLSGGAGRSGPLFPFPMPTLFAGAPPETARTALVLLHGRGARADDMLPLAAALGATPQTAIVAPQAPGGSWYPQRFVAPLPENEPFLSQALAGLAETVAALEAAGIAAERVVLAGFSQGACLAAEFAARHARRYGALVAFSGGLIGPEGTRWAWGGSLAGTPAFLGCADADPHIPLARVEETARVLTGLGAAVTARVYRGTWHTIVPDEVAQAQALLAPLGFAA